MVIPKRKSYKKKSIKSYKQTSFSYTSIQETRDWTVLMVLIKASETEQKHLIYLEFELNDDTVNHVKNAIKLNLPSKNINSRKKINKNRDLRN